MHHAMFLLGAVFKNVVGFVKKGENGKCPASIMLCTSGCMYQIKK
jgi:hypothetical protein